MKKPAKKVAKKTAITTRKKRVARGLSKDWAIFGTSLTATLDALSASQVLILSVTGQHRFVQFAQQAKWGVRAECVANAYLKPKDRLSKADQSALAALGWMRPTLKPAGSGTVGSDVDGSPNWFAQFDKPVDYVGLVDLTIRTFTEVYGVRHPSELLYKAFDEAGTTILLPTFRLEQEPESVANKAPIPPLVIRVAQAAEYGSDSGIEPRSEKAFTVTVNGHEFMVVVEETRPLARILCPLFPAAEYAGNLFEAINEMNAQFVPFGHVYMRDGEVRYAAEVLVNPFHDDVIPVALELAASIVDQLYIKKDAAEQWKN